MLIWRGVTESNFPLSEGVWCLDESLLSWNYFRMSRLFMLPPSLFISGSESGLLSALKEWAEMLGFLLAMFKLGLPSFSLKSITLESNLFLFAFPGKRELPFLRLLDDLMFIF